jgi:hypothetical protein
MKKILLVALLAVGIPAFGQTEVQLSWVSGNPGVPSCPATSPSACVSGYTISLITNPDAPVVLSSTISPTATSYTYTVPPLTAAGNEIFGIVANAYNSAGTAVTSSQATTTVSVPAVPPNPPTGFTGSTETASAEPAAKKVIHADFGAIGQ